MIIKIPVYDDNNEIQPLEIEAVNVFEAMEIARKQNLNFVDSYVAVCWYNGESID